MMTEKEATLTDISRRNFLAGISAGSMVLMGRWASGDVIGLTDTEDAASGVARFAPDYFVSIAPDDTVTILAHRSEMGTGIRTMLPRVVADELEADWERVVIEQAIGDKRLGDQNTDGSNSIRFYFQRMRVAGATARAMLQQAAAKEWGVQPDDCVAENHRITHAATGRTISYGALVATARTLEVPAKDTLTFKPRSRWRYIGKDAPIVDMDDILTGKAVYGIDARMDNQLYAVIARPDVVGGRVKSVDDGAARKISGVVDVLQIPPLEGAPTFQPLGGVAVLADSTWAAWKGRDALEIVWDDGPNAEYDTDVFANELAAVVGRSGKIVRKDGKGADGLSEGTGKKHTATYSVPHLSHAPMETPCAVADVRTDAAGKVDSCQVLAATQNPQAVQQAVGAALQIDPSEVLVNVTLLGSGFGRKSKPDYCVEAALLSLQAKRPVHVTWTREDDIRHDYFHTISAIHCEGVLNEAGKPVAWLERVAYPPIASTFRVGADVPDGGEQEMGLLDLPFAIPDIQLEVCPAPAHTRIGWLRSVAHIHQNFAASSFADELAHLSGSDPLEFLLQLLGPDRNLFDQVDLLANRGASKKDYPYAIGRLKNVLRRAAKAADWSRAKDLPKGTGLGIAGCRSFLGYAAHVVEVNVRPSGHVSIPHVWSVIDAGTVVSPDRVRAQIEGAVTMGASQAMKGRISFKKGRTVETNYDAYAILTMDNAPREIHVDIVESQEPPAGVGETGIPPLAPALCNAIFAATGKRIRKLPISDHNLKWS